MTLKLTPPRSVPPRDDFYMGLAFMASAKSKDPSTQISAFIVSADGEPKGWGYNGPPRQIDDQQINWERPDKYPYIIHAEDNAIKHSSGNLEGATIYINARPCPGCMLDIIEAGISRVVYFEYEKFTDNSSMIANTTDASKVQEMARKAKVRLEPFRGNINWVRDWMCHLEQKGVFNS